MPFVLKPQTAEYELLIIYRWTEDTARDRITTLVICSKYLEEHET